jgi:hypothetical protein
MLSNKSTKTQLHFIKLCDCNFVNSVPLTLYSFLTTQMLTSYNK